MLVPGLLFKGSLIGLTIAMPMGPIGFMCLRHALIHGATCGIISGAGVALADALCGVIAGLGVAALSNFIDANQIQSWLQLLGSIFLVFLGYFTFKAKHKSPHAKDVSVSHLRVFATMFFITISNPMTLLSFTGIYAALGIGGVDEELLTTLVISLGVFIGSLSWWLALSLGSHYFNVKTNLLSHHLINRLSGSFFVLFGIVGIFYSIKMMLYL